MTELKLRKLRIEEVTFSLDAEQDHAPVRGNAMASGDDAVDKEVEDAIIARLDRGDIWAWADVTVTARYHHWKGEAYLGGCCYDDAKDFIANSGYYEQMQQDALDDLHATLTAALADFQRNILPLVEAP